MTILDKIEGRTATAWRLELPDTTENPDWKGTVSHWLIYSPQAHPVWHYFMLSAVHLRPVEGQSQEPVLQTPDSTHEVLLVALNPELEPWDPNTAMERLWQMFRDKESPILIPINIVHQIRGASDEHAVKLTELIAKGLSIGFLPLEPDDVMGGRQWWSSVIDKTMEHIRLGTHPSEN